MRSLTSAVLAAIALSCVAGQVQASGIGDRIAHTFLKFNNVPLTTDAATAADWAPALSTCQDGMGVAWTPGGSGLSQHHPIIAYYSKSGQISGLGIMVFGDLPPYLVETGWWLRNDQETHMVQVGFRNPFDVCSSTEFEEMVGDRLVVNPSSTRFNIPLTHSDAIATGFVQGACIGGMGVHHSYDIKYHPRMTWNASTFMPITPMYDQQDGSLNAFLVLTSANQQLQPFFGDWEGPFIAHLLCENWCDDACIDDLGATSHTWNTMHFMLKDHSTLKCNSGHCP